MERLKKYGNKGIEKQAEKDAEKYLWIIL